MLLRRALLLCPLGLALLTGSAALASGKLHILGKPAPETQFEKPVAERGVNPCATPDPGFGAYDPWEEGPTLGQVLVPHAGATDDQGRFDLMIHFHGHEPARKEWVRVMRRAVFVGIDLGVGSGVYAQPFEDPEAFPQLLHSIELAVAKHVGRDEAHVRHLGLSSWSAGYGAIRQILRTQENADRIEAVLLLDSLHADYAGSALDEWQMAPFATFAEAASAGEELLFVSHSSITPPGYASTTETARYLVDFVGGKPHAGHPRKGDPYGLELVTRFSKGNFHVRGFAGNGPLDHCAQVGMYGEALRAYVRPRWSPPPAVKGKSSSAKRSAAPPTKQP